MKGLSPKKPIVRNKSTDIARKSIGNVFSRVRTRQPAHQSTPLMRRLKRGSKQTLRSVLLSKTFNTGFKVVVGVLISSGIFYSSYIMIGRSFAGQVVISQSEIIARASKLTALPKEDPREIVRVQDPEDLKRQSDFFKDKDIKEGDYILMYPQLAVIYDLRNNRIIAVKEVLLK